jgi:hypothetical protein
VLINRDSRSWVLVCLVLFALATAAFFFVPGWGARRLNGPSGGSWEGIALGAAGSAMMLFALLLGARKKVRTMRIGRAYWWMQGHVWFGLLSYPVILYHAGFRWGGPLTQVIMWLFTIVIVSGIVGIVLQQIMPTKLMRDVAMETIYEQIDRIVGQLRDEAAALAAAAGGQAEEAPYEVDAIPAGATATAVVPQRTTATAARQVADFHRLHVAPFLAETMPRRSPLADPATANNMFGQLRDAMPPGLRQTAESLREICEERRQLARQKRLHHWLHGWLLVHVPLSYALMLLAAVHAVQALRFTTIGG